MKKIFLLILPLLAVMFSSCSKDENPNANFSDFYGTYNGYVWKDNVMIETTSFTLSAHEDGKELATLKWGDYKLRVYIIESAVNYIRVGGAGSSHEADLIFHIGSSSSTSYFQKRDGEVSFYLDLLKNPYGLQEYFSISSNSE